MNHLLEPRPPHPPHHESCTPSYIHRLKLIVLFYAGVPLLLIYTSWYNARLFNLHYDLILYPILGSPYQFI
jgi:hypothetical protein